MNYKPDESTLISYIYGELDEKEREKVQKYFQEHPEELKHVRDLTEVTELMGKVKDKEVIAPPVIAYDDTRVMPIWKTTYFRMAVSIAASFLLIIVAGRMAGTEINYKNGELRISFRAAQPKEIVDPLAYSGLTEAEVQKLIDESLVKNNEVVNANLTETQKKLDRAIRQNVASNSSQVNDLVREASQVSQNQIREFVAGLQKENLKLMQDYLQLSTTDQKKYMENLLVDFSKYLQEQRNQDLMVFQTRMSSIEQNTDLFKQETEQILASIISNSELNKKQGNY